MPTGIRVREIAKQLSMSPGTISKVLRGTSGTVSAETAGKVLRYCLQQGYMSSIEAGRIFSKMRSKSEGLQIFTVTCRRGIMAYDVVFSGICSQMQQSGLYSSYYVIHDQNDLKRFPYQKADGVIVLGKIGSEILHEFQDRNINVVIVDNRIPKVNVSSVNSNNQESVLNAVEILAKLGHKRIAFAALYSKENREYTFHQRELGYLAGLSTDGLEFDERMLVREYCSNGVFSDFNSNSYEDDLTRLSERILQIKPMPTAVIAANDLIAYYIRKVVTFKGLKVPKDLSIIGYDGWHRHSTVSNAGYTPTSTMVVNWEEMGRQAINLMMEIQIDPNEQKYRHIELPTEYEDLGTVAAPGR